MTKPAPKQLIERLDLRRLPLWTFYEIVELLYPITQDRSVVNDRMREAVVAGRLSLIEASALAPVKDIAFRLPEFAHSTYFRPLEVITWATETFGEFPIKAADIPGSPEWKPPQLSAKLRKKRGSARRALEPLLQRSAWNERTFAAMLYGIDPDEALPAGSPASFERADRIATGQEFLGRAVRAGLITALAESESPANILYGSRWLFRISDALEVGQKYFPESFPFDQDDHHASSMPGITSDHPRVEINPVANHEIRLREALDQLRALKFTSEPMAWRSNDPPSWNLLICPKEAGAEFRRIATHLASVLGLQDHPLGMDEGWEPFLELLRQEERSERDGSGYTPTSDDGSEGQITGVVFVAIRQVVQLIRDAATYPERGMPGNRRRYKTKKPNPLERLVIEARKAGKEGRSLWDHVGSLAKDAGADPIEKWKNDDLWPGSFPAAYCMPLFKVRMQKFVYNVTERFPHLLK